MGKRCLVCLHHEKVTFQHRPDEVCRLRQELTPGLQVMVSSLPCSGGNSYNEREVGDDWSWIKISKAVEVVTLQS